MVSNFYVDEMEHDWKWRWVEMSQKGANLTSKWKELIMNFFVSSTVIRAREISLEKFCTFMTCRGEILRAVERMWRYVESFKDWGGVRKFVYFATSENYPANLPVNVTSDFWIDCQFLGNLFSCWTNIS